MVDKKLINLVETAIKRGHSKSEIKNKLESKHWPKDEINKVFEIANKDLNKKKPKEKKQTILEALYITIILFAIILTIKYILAGYWIAFGINLIIILVLALIFEKIRVHKKPKKDIKKPKPKKIIKKEKSPKKKDKKQNILKGFFILIILLTIILAALYIFNKNWRMVSISAIIIFILFFIFGKLNHHKKKKVKPKNTKKPKEIIKSEKKLISKKVKRKITWPIVMYVTLIILGLISSAILLLFSLWSLLLLIIVVLIISLTFLSKLAAKAEIKSTPRIAGVQLEKKWYETDIDKLLELINKYNRIPISEAQRIFKIKKNEIERWAKLLESRELIKIYYPPFGKGILMNKEVKIKNPNAKKTMRTFTVIVITTLILLILLYYVRRYIPI